MKTLHLIVKGKVQGVFYRASARDKAKELGITGWVKNTPGNDVEIMATGNEENLGLFVIWCRKGPMRARVEAVQVHDIVMQHFPDFEIVR